MPETPSSAYVHIPFCVRKCRYCDFPSYAGREDCVGEYTEAVCSEIRHAADVLSRDHALKPLRTVFFGGGTPTLAGADRLVRILRTLRDTFSLEEGTEATLEANPGTVTPDGFARLRAGGFNRVSLGLQAVQPHLLRTLGRIHSAEDFFDAVRAARSAGFENIGADIMLGLPGQTPEDLRETLARVIGAGVDHVSFYSLQVEEGTPFFELQSAGRLDLPEEDAERAMYHETRRTLESAGLPPYEISNAARPGRECRHNLVYWRAEEYLGFGCAAHSYVGGTRRANTADLDAYVAAMGRGHSDGAFPAARELETVGREGQMKEYMMLGFRLSAGPDAEGFFRRFGERAETRFAAELADLDNRGFIERTGTGWRLTVRGLDMANQVFMAFV
ncbi:MAG: radical SAM family heme chaperone HemW [Clostridia bacterium]|nr:radical SAM family heme chaperone HemW [Clostridia bacterium]